MSKKKKAHIKTNEKMSGEFEETFVELSDGDYRHYLQGAYGFGGGYGDFKGHVISISKQRALFDHLFVEFMQNDGSIVDGKEEHVWVYDPQPFIDAGIKAGDKVSFFGKVYAYKRKDGSRDYGIKECENIERIEDYELPKSEELDQQFAESLVCDEICMFKDHCYGFCIAPFGWREQMVNTILQGVQPK